MIVLDCDVDVDSDALDTALLDFVGLHIDDALLRRLEAFVARFVPGATAEAIRGVRWLDSDKIYLSVRCGPRNERRHA